ncbi:hypothetical protein D3C80_1516440 [compost metagenome]
MLCRWPWKSSLSVSMAPLTFFSMTSTLVSRALAEVARCSAAWPMVVPACSRALRLSVLEPTNWSRLCWLANVCWPTTSINWLPSAVSVAKVLSCSCSSSPCARWAANCC